MFNPSQFHETVQRISSKIPDVQHKASQIDIDSVRLANEWYIPEPIARLIIWLKDELIKLAEELMNMMTQVMEGIEAPITMWEDAYKWETVRGIASSVAADVNPSSLGSTGQWTGDAATAYTNAIGPQSTAAAQLATIADSTASSLQSCAEAGLAFYIAVALVVAQFIAAEITAAAADATGVGAPAGLAAGLGAAATAVGVLVALVAAMGTLIGTEASQASTLHGLAMDSTAFPSGRWPVAANV